uniref:Uncharacterized protein n=1 Tax=viral metagenome TaxID=1070528 RepID=A0A6C0ER59_9ZZZZ
MSGIADWFHKTVTDITGKTPQQHADAIKNALPTSANTFMSDSSSSKALGAPSESVGTTMTGGRRRKTRAGKRDSKKTRRGGKYY